MDLSEIIDQEIFDNGLHLLYAPLAGDVRGLYYLDSIAVDSGIEGEYARNCVKRHELEHFYTCPYNIRSLPRPLQRKLEAAAHRRSVAKLVPLDALILLYLGGARAPWEYADALEIDEEFFLEALKLYDGIYGKSCRYKGYRITFLPFEIA